MRKLTLALNEPELATLEQLAKKHPKEYFRVRGKALIAVSAGQDIATVSAVLKISGESVRTWIHDWEQLGRVGILKARKGSRPTKLTPELVELAVELAKEEAMSLAQIAAAVRQKRPDAPEFSLDRLSVRLRERGLSYKRTRYSLKKKKPGRV